MRFVRAAIARQEVRILDMRLKTRGFHSTTANAEFA